MDNKAFEQKVKEVAALTALLEADCKARHDTEVESKVLEQKAKEMTESTVRLEAERKARAELTAVLEADRGALIAKLEAGRKARDEQKAREVAEHAQ